MIETSAAATRHRHAVRFRIDRHRGGETIRLLRVGERTIRRRGTDIGRHGEEEHRQSSTAASSAGQGQPVPVVLARKYRPATFADLIGQEAMVTTLRNAFATDRIAQGYMLTGVRGVGKTTTARILSRALNYARRDGVDRPTFDMAEYGRHCAEIMEGRHPDVLEMDAASNTGVDNMREIIESARYRPLVARYKVYLDRRGAHALEGRLQRAF